MKFKHRQRVVIFPLAMFAIQGYAVASNAPAGVPSEATRVQAFLQSRYSSSDVRHSFHTKFGETVDCIDFFAQPGVKAMAAAGTPILQLPTPQRQAKIPRGWEDVALTGTLDDQGNARACSPDSVPILRITADGIAAAGGLDKFVRAHQKTGGHAQPPSPNGNSLPDSAGPAYAHVQQDYNGPGKKISFGYSLLSVWSPPLDYDPRDGHSLSQTWTSGPGTAGEQTVEFGWTVDWTLNAGDYQNPGGPHLFIFSTNDGYTNGCYNGLTQCAFGNGPQRTGLTFIAEPGASYFPGQELPSNDYNSDINASMEFETENGNLGYGASGWNLVGVGVYPATNFNGNMKTFASGFTVGAEVSDPNPGNGTGPFITPMGSGAPANSETFGDTYQPADWVNPSYACGAYTGVSTIDKGASCSFNTPYSTVTAYYSPLVYGSEAIYYGNVAQAFWGHNIGFGFTPIGDWANGLYKGECGVAQSVSGVSISGGHTHAITCDVQQLNSSYSGCYARSIASGDSRGDTDGGWDWDPGFHKAECGANEYVAGLAQTTSGNFQSVMCCAGSSSVVQHYACTTVSPATLESKSPPQGPDFDPGTGNTIASCPLGYYLAGASTSGPVHKLLCCYIL